MITLSGYNPFAAWLEEKKLTPAEKKKREEIAQAIERENPGMDMSDKMAIATSQAKKVAEEEDIDDEPADGSSAAEIRRKEMRMNEKNKNPKKARNPVAAAVRDPQFRKRVVKDKSKFDKKKSRQRKISMEDAIKEVIGWSGRSTRPKPTTRSSNKDKGDPNVKPITGNPLRDKYIRKGLIKK